MGNYFIKTWGCQMNEHDSEIMAGILENIGYAQAHKEEAADVIIYNTCLIRENAELKLYGNLGHLKVLKKKNPSLIIAVCGCIPQKEEYLKIIQEKYPYVDLIFGTHNYNELEDFLKEALTAQKTVTHVIQERGESKDPIQSIRKHSHKAFVNIIYGCNNFCTYCVVPYTRGREKSRKHEEIILEIKRLVQAGYNEIMLLGQNVNSYGHDIQGEISFPELLYKISQESGLDRIRFMTSHPKDISQELIQAMGEIKAVCPHLHLPLQSGSNQILSKMNRHYTKEKYLDVVTKLKQSVPDISITTDIIVGFPGETESDFNETLSVCREVQFDSAYTFLYSRRKGTGADKMPEQVEPNVKHRRFNTLLNEIKEIAAMKNSREIDKIYQVFVESFTENSEGNNIYVGRTGQNKLIHFESDENVENTFQQVKITKSNIFNFDGELITT